MDGPTVVEIEGKTTSYLIKDLMPGLYYSITVSYGLCSVSLNSSLLLLLIILYRCKL